VKISICIPTFNRAKHLVNCLHSVKSCKENSKIDFQVCISDNGSTDNTEEVVRHAQTFMDIKYYKNSENIGIPRNFINVIEMADGEFTWLLGDDDLLLPEAINTLYELISKHEKVDFFYINSFHLTTEYVASFPQPFNIENVPNNMKPFSSWTSTGELPFMNLVDPRVSFDFLGGMFLAVFRRELWIKNVHTLDQIAIMDSHTFSHFDNTFPHVKIFSKAFANSQAFFNTEPLSINLTGAREWSPMYPLVHSIRLVESLVEYKNNGLPYLQYLKCRNFALNNFIPDLVSMFLRRKNSGFAYIKPLRLILSNCLYPNFYLSFFNYFIRKSKALLTPNVSYEKTLRSNTGNQ